MDTSALSPGTALHCLSAERPSLGQADGPGLLWGHQEAVCLAGEPPSHDPWKPSVSRFLPCEKTSW